MTFPSLPQTQGENRTTLMRMLGFPCPFVCQHNWFLSVSFVTDGIYHLSVNKFLTVYLFELNFGILTIKSKLISIED